MQQKKCGNRRIIGKTKMLSILERKSIKKRKLFFSFVSIVRFIAVVALVFV